jgi:pSer/pThr/pTyr-binding forkhead associated (FHA) protein
MDLTEDLIAGWLIIHTEGIEDQSFPLKEGKNIIGRLTSTNLPDIPINNDKYVSRQHACINIARNALNQFVYLISDLKSTNGIFINGDLEKLSDTPFELKDADTIQIGETKLVLKTIADVKTAEAAVSLVKKMDYKDTVSVENHSSVVLKKIIKR